MYKNVVPCYCNSDLSLEVSLSSQWFLVAGLNVFRYAYGDVACTMQLQTINGSID